MKISKLRTNHVENPLGFEFNNVRLSWITESSSDQYQTAAQVEIAEDELFQEIVFDSGKREAIDSLSFMPNIELAPRTRYFWRVTVWGNAGGQATSDPVFFETAKMDEPWQGNWIAADFDKDIHPLLRKEFSLPENIISARAYVCGVGLYELFINGQKAGDEYLAPGFHAYDFWLQYQTYDITDLLTPGENAIGVMLGNGMYKGRFGFEGGYENIYGDQLAFIGEIILTLADGSERRITTDETWQSAPSPITFSGVYDGEAYDANREVENWACAPVGNDWHGVQIVGLDKDKLTARLSPPVKIMEEIKPIGIIHTPAGETVLDMGQNMTGWIRFKTNAPAGTKLHLQFGEILQEENFYRDNFRTAKAEYTYISDGSEREVQPFFTYFGFRYVKVDGFEQVNIDDFTGCVLYSELEKTGHIETSNPDVNRLFLNAMWGQKGNFLDVPTDCPQRDERMGWTGDAQIFASTACYNMYSPAFYQKYMRDLREEQIRLNGSVPFVVPTIKPKDAQNMFAMNGSAAWGDAATVIPWILYMHYGDKELLRQQFDTMKDWVDHIKRVDDESGGSRLWKAGFHFGDWLSLDVKDPSILTGGTDSYYIASAYYCYSAQLVVKAARVLGYTVLADEYTALVDEIKEAIQKEYFTANGRCAIPTQTAKIVALYMDLVPESYRQRLIEDLKLQLRDDDMHLTTGFVGTPYFCPVLSESGANEYAYELLLNDDYPSWLYAVKMGATTIWERWNSVLSDGSISDTGMNSLNHYAYGSIAEWMYRYMCGITPVEYSPGFKRFELKPQPFGRLSYAKASFESASGLIKSEWTIEKDGSLTFDFTIPFNTTADIILPDADLQNVQLNSQPLSEGKQEGTAVAITLGTGHYIFTYMPTKTYLLMYSTNDTVRDLLGNEDTKEVLLGVLPEINENPMILKQVLKKTVKEMQESPFVSHLVTEEKVKALDEQLGRVLVRV
ncbi:glycoside hydrolase family 78 protein [Domibacillus indicus]|uniref:alpha-L-rhamnosidase n=1 Tax=Domibacillus indicus TaxID=1437523 RepID=UPI00203B3859|nr:alpha-L-rhamnosidase [Domibacillus indicus]MCM3790276.1 glycoside hydrolase family 78 protein [Domibacillus indicus]